VRCTDELWASAKRRADADGTQMNTVIVELLEGYARGYINLPKITKSYVPQTVPRAAVAPLADQQSLT
jgi:hypothetical protein